MSSYLLHSVLFVGILIVAAFLGTASYPHFGSSLPALALGSVDDVTPSQQGNEQSVTKIIPTSAVFTGDIMLARYVERVMLQQGAAYIFEDLTLFATSSAWVGNFEGAVAPVHRPTPNGGMNFSVASSSVAALRSLPFSHMSLANNHSYDHGEVGFSLTKQTLRQSGLEPFGDQSISSSSVTYLTLDGGVVALVGLYALGVWPDLDRLGDTLADAQQRSDLVVVYVHWGEEYQSTHSTFQRALAEELSVLGVDAVIGHHPHVVQDIARIGDTLVFYSLGNFVFDQFFSDEVEEGMLVEVSLVDGEARYQLHGVSSQGSRSRPRLLPAYDQERFLSRLARKSDSSLRSAIQSGVITQYIQ